MPPKPETNWRNSCANADEYPVVQIHPRADTFLPIRHQPADTAALSLYPDLFAICGRGRQKIRRIQRRLAYTQTHRPLPPLRRTRTRPRPVIRTIRITRFPLISRRFLYNAV